MTLKRYCVTVVDSWTPTRTFWTFKGAMAYRDKHAASAFVHQWFGGQWVEIITPPRRYHAHA